MRPDEVGLSREHTEARDAGELVVVGRTQRGDELRLARHRGVVGRVLILEAGTELALDEERLGGDAADIDAGAAVHSGITLDEEHGLARTS